MKREKDENAKTLSKRATLNKALMQRSLSTLYSEAVQEWVLAWTYTEDKDGPGSECTCTHSPIYHVYGIRNIHTKAELEVGCVCVDLLFEPLHRAATLVRYCKALRDNKDIANIWAGQFLYEHGVLSREEYEEYERTAKKRTKTLTESQLVLRRTVNENLIQQLKKV
jgi:hypothetical protein